LCYTKIVMDHDVGHVLRGRLRKVSLAPIVQASEARRTMVVLGDSITFGSGLAPELSYPSLLDQSLNRRSQGSLSWRVINAGVPGDTVLGAEMRYQRDVSCTQPDVLIIALGLNDASLRRTRYDDLRERMWLACRHPWVRWELRLEKVLAWLRRRVGTFLHLQAVNHGREEGHRAEPRVRPELFAQALEDLARRARSEGRLVYFLSLPPLAWDRISADQATQYRLYEGIIRAVAKSNGVALIEVGNVSRMDQGNNYWQEDGIHPSAEGQARLAACIAVRFLPDDCQWRCYSGLSGVLASDQ